MGLKLNANGNREANSVFVYANVVIIVAFSLIFSRLWYLQIIKGDHFRNRSEENRIRIQEITAPRGIIFDRAGNPLVDSFPSFDISLFREDVPNLQALVPPLSRALDLPSEKVQAKIEQTKGAPPFQLLKLKTDISWEELAHVETRRLDLPGILVDVVNRRNYLHGRLAAHLFGYLGEIGPRELEQEEYADHKMGALIGKAGLEQIFESYLMGENGGRQVEVNARGQKIRVLGKVEPNPGNNLHLTLDLGLQKTAEEAMAGKRGAVVAMDPQSGDILAMTSKPDFDPNLFARGISPENWRSLVESPAHPLQNRAIQGQYPPGSVYKIVMAIAALEEKVITPETAFSCPGFLYFGNREYRCWKKEGHGRVNLNRAIIESCDVYFYNVGLRLGVDRIARYATALGLGRPTGFPLGREKAGLIPTSSWKAKRFGIAWQPGENLSIAIGQGFNLVTPLQTACALSAVANGDRLFPPRIVQSIRAPHGELLRNFPRPEGIPLSLSPETLAIVRQALWGVVNSPGGTGGRARLEGFDVAGKTGTAQVIQRREGRPDPAGIEFQDHAWFACFAPLGNPRIVVVVLVEHGGHGGAAAAPVARKMLEAFLQRRDMEQPPAPRLSGRESPMS